MKTLLMPNLGAAIAGALLMLSSLAVVAMPAADEVPVFGQNNPMATQDYSRQQPVYRTYGQRREAIDEYVPAPGIPAATRFYPRENTYYQTPVAAPAQPMMPPMPGFGLPEAFTKTFQLPGFMRTWNMDLSDGQRGDLRKLQKGLRRINHSLSGELMDAVDGIQEVFEESARDPKRVGKAYEQYFNIQRRWIEAQVAASNRIEQIAAAARRAHEEMVVPVPVPAPVVDDSAQDEPKAAE